MCTVSVVASSGPGGRRRVRVACNRDELRSRPAAQPPVRRPAGNFQALLPLDAVSGGTWIAVSSAGLAFALLNWNSGAAGHRAGNLSRGLVIPELLDAQDADHAVERALALHLGSFAPFRLVVVSQREWAEVVWDAESAAEVRRKKLAGPVLFTSSGLGDRLVQAPRLRVFDQFLVRRTPTWRRQDAFHRHQWPDRPDISVRMHRADARTVSYTTIRIGPEHVALSYHADAPGKRSPAWTLRARRPAAREAPSSAGGVK